MARPLINELVLSPGVSAEAQEKAQIQQLQAGSEEAFRWLVSRYAPAVYRLACRLLNNPADASDVAQEVFLKVFRGVGQFHGDSSLKTWIYHIAVNTVWNQNRWWRRHRGAECALETTDPETGMEELPVAEDGPDPLQSVLSHETQDLVQTALGRLEESHRLVLVLREIEGFSYEEIAEVLKVSAGTVKSRLARARQSLRRALETVMEPAAREVRAWRPAEAE